MRKHKHHQTYCRNCEDRHYRKTKPRIKADSRFDVATKCKMCGKDRLLWVPPHDKNDGI